jgi:beta-lactamase class A
MHRVGSVAAGLAAVSLLLGTVPDPRPAASASRDPESRGGPPPESAPDLRACADPVLQADLERVIDGLGLGTAVAKRHLALALVDLSDASSPRLAMLNGDEMMYAGSLPKIAILLGAFVQVERGRLVLDDATLASLNRMIRISSNEDASAMLAKVGEATLLDILTSPRYHFYDPKMGGGLWVGKPYGKAAAYRRDPLTHLSHGATAYQVARFYYLFDRGLLLSPELTRMMKAVLADSEIHHKFVKGLASRPEVHLYRKSGTWHQFHSDSALIEGPNRRYVLVGLADRREGGEWLVRIALPIDEMIESRHPRVG